MKQKDYNTIENNLESAMALLDDIYENCDTSKKHENENDHEINQWNKRFNKVFDEIKCLKEELIFIFRIE